jgi:GTP-binding protein Era
MSRGPKRGAGPSAPALPPADLPERAPADAASAAPAPQVADAVPAAGPPTDAPQASAPQEPARCGTLALVGRPNVGKSTLLNALVGQKISITSRKPQTTRHRIQGVCTEGAAQFVFVDTPGYQTRHGNALNRVLNRTVQSTLADVDLVLLVVEAGRFGAADAQVLAQVPPGKKVLLVANKLDLARDRGALLPWARQLAEAHGFLEIVPVSAKRPEHMQQLRAVLARHLPEAPWWFDADQLTDRSERFLAAEIVREKLFRLTGDELPYTSTVLIDGFDEEPGRSAARMLRIAATIVVEREAHKAMIIGEGGDKLKRISTEARLDMERLFDARVFLQTWVKVRSGWADDEARLSSYGYR